MVLCLGEPPGGFCDVGCCCCCFSSLEIFTFPGYFTLPPALHPGLWCPWRPPPARSSTLATFSCFILPGFSVTVLPRALRFWVGIFYQQAFFILRSLTDIFGTLLWLRCVQEQPIQHPPLCLPFTELSLPADTWSWTTHTVVTRPLIYQ